MVEIITSTADLLRIRGEEKLPVGFVPTMGSLHAGHLSLLESALKDFQVVYFSIFVNPKQFGPNEDFNLYPRSLKEDILLIEDILTGFPNAKVIVYAPSGPSEVFPDKEGHLISVEYLSKIIEGKIRPGHFDGVTTVVHRLFTLVRPVRAYFGLKDYQQYIIIKQMVKDLALPVEIVGLPIVREESGLALSSRNQYLTKEQKKSSLALSRELKELAGLIGGKRERLALAKEKIRDLMKDKNWNYLEIRDADTLSEDVSICDKIILLAVYQLGTTRILDNVQVGIQ